MNQAHVMNTVVDFEIFLCPTYNTVLKVRVKVKLICSTNRALGQFGNFFKSRPGFGFSPEIAAFLYFPCMKIVTEKGPRYLRPWQRVLAHLECPVFVAYLCMLLKCYEFSGEHNMRNFSLSLFLFSSISFLFLFAIWFHDSRAECDMKS